MDKESGIKIIASNKKAKFNYFLSDYTECGIVLKGTEIKSLRVHACSIGDSYIIIRNGEAEIINMHINPYEQGNIFNQDPLRNRKLLLHKKKLSGSWKKHKKVVILLSQQESILKRENAKWKLL